MYIIQCVLKVAVRVGYGTAVYRDRLRTLNELKTSITAYVRNISQAFYIYGSVHLDSILIRSKEMQNYAGIYLLQNYSTCFGYLLHQSSGVHQNVTAASGTGHITCQSNNLLPARLN